MVRRTGLLLVLLIVASVAGLSLHVASATSITVGQTLVPPQPTVTAPLLKPPANPALVSSPPVSGPPPPFPVSHPLDAAQYFNAVRNPAPHGAPAQPPVPLAAQAAAAGPARSAVPATPLIQQSSTWMPLGPSPAGGGQIPGGGNVSGRVYALAASGGTMFAGAATGGVWRSYLPPGSLWTSLTDSQVSPAIGAIAVDPTNPLKIYAATGDATPSGPSYGSPSFFGAGILASSDGGVTWSTLGQSTFTGIAVYDMAITPDGQTLYLATTGGFFIGTAFKGQWSFTSRSPGVWTSVKLNPANSTIVDLGRQDGGAGGPWVYNRTSDSLAASQFCSNPNSTVQNCTPATIAGSHVGRTTIAVGPSAGLSSYAYASMECLSSCPLVGATPVKWWGVYESTDSGATYHPLVNPFPNFVGTFEYEQTSYDLTLAVDPLDSNSVYFGLVDLWKYSYNGNAVTNISSPGVPQASAFCYPWGTGRFTLAQGIHCDQHAIAFDSAGSLWIGNDGGVFRSPPGSEGAVWEDRNDGLDITQFYPGVGYDPSNPTRLLGGTQDNGTQTASGQAWQMTLFGDGGFTAIDPTDPTNTWYTEYTGLQIYKTTNGSLQWSASTGPTWNLSINGMPQKPDGDVVGAAFIAPFTMDPTLPAAAHHLDLLAGADRPYLSTTGATVWNDISGLGGLFPLPSFSSISATTICPDTTGGGIFYLGTTDGRIFSTANGYNATPTWAEMSVGLPGQWVTRIDCPAGTNNGNDGIVYATVGGSQTLAGTHVFQKTLAATSWTSIQGNLPNTTVSTVVADTRLAPARLYVGTDLGVYWSTDGGTTWNLYGSSLPNVPVSDLVLDTVHNELLAATHGRGWWQSGAGPGQVSCVPASGSVVPPKTTVSCSFTPNTGDVFGGWSTTGDVSPASSSSLSQSFLLVSPGAATITANWRDGLNTPHTLPFAYTVAAVGPTAPTVSCTPPTGSVLTSSSVVNCSFAAGSSGATLIGWTASGFTPTATGNPTPSFVPLPGAKVSGVITVQWRDAFGQTQTQSWTYLIIGP